MKTKINKVSRFIRGIVKSIEDDTSMWVFDSLSGNWINQDVTITYDDAGEDIESSVLINADLQILPWRDKRFLTQTVQKCLLQHRISYYNRIAKQHQDEINAVKRYYENLVE